MKDKIVLITGANKWYWQGITGKYFAKKKIKAASEKCSDIKLQKELWQLSERLTGINK